MTQVKLFEEFRIGSTTSEVIEERVNKFLQENASSIKVIDIKYTTSIPEVKGSNWTRVAWTVMIIYETLNKQ